MPHQTPQPETANGFNDLPLPAELLAVLDELGHHHPTPIQCQAIPLLVAGKDVIGQAKTGSGKTAAFSLPILARVRVERRAMQALILCPTRELSTQVAREIRKLGRRCQGLQVLVLAGGQPLRSQLDALHKGVHITVGTPGRVLDHLRRGSLDLRYLRCIVLDEADRMLDMGFDEDMQQIFAAAPASRQTVLFSATFPDAIAAMSRSLQDHPVRVTVADDGAGAAAPDVRQVVYQVQPEDKLDALRQVLRTAQPSAALVFCNLKLTVNEVAAALAADGFSSDFLHGDLEQIERDRVLAKFRNQSVRVLVATDVAARGIDVEGLDLVCNYDLPGKPDTYVHRIGRTGRAGKKGLALSFATRREGAKIEAIEALTGRSLERARLDSAPISVPVAKAAAAPSPNAAMATLYIAGGRKDKVRPGDILGALTGDAGGLPGEAIGKIEIHDRFAYVAVLSHMAANAVENLRSGKIKGRKFQVELVR